MGKEEIALKLKQARVKANMTQKQVADILGMTYQAISNYERGKTKVESDVLVKLCEIYRISVPYILSDSNIDLKNVKETKQMHFCQDARLQKIINYYNNTDDIGRNMLAEQAEFIQSKHPIVSEKEA